MTDSIRGGGQPLAVRSFVVNKDETSVQEGTGVRGSTPPGKTVEARPGEVPKADRFERASGDAFTGLLNSPATPGMSSTEAGIGVSIAEFLQQGIPSGPASDVGKPATPGPVIVLQDSASTAASGGAGAAGPLGSKPGETGIQGERMRQDLDARFPSTNVGGGEVPPDESGPEVDGGAQDVRDPSAQALAGKGIECGDAVAGGAASGPASGGGGVEAGGADNNRWQANSAIVPDLPAGGELPGGCAGESAGGQSVGTKSQKATVDGNSAGLGPEIPSTGESPGGGSSVSDGWQDTRDADRRAGAEGSIETPPGGDHGGSAGGTVGEQKAWEAVSSFFDSGRDHSTTTGGGESQSGGGGVEAGGADDNRWQANSAIVPDLPAGGELPGGRAGESAGGPSVGTKSQKATVDGNSAGLGPEIPSTGESPGGGSSVSDGWQDTRDADRRAGAEGSIETPPGGDNGGSAGGTVGEQEAWEAVSSFFDSGRDHSTTTGGGESQSGGGGVEAGGADDNRWQANSAIVPDLPAGEELPGGRAGEGGPAVGSMSQNAFVDGNSAGLGPEIPGTGESPEGGSSVSDGMQETGNLDRGAGAGGVETPRSGGGSGGGSEGVDGDGESTSSAGGSAEGTEPQPVEQATDAEDPPEADAVEGDGQSGAPKGYEYRTGPMAHEIGTTVGARFGGEPGSDEFGQQAGQVRVTTGGVGGASGEPNQQMDTGHFEETSAGGSTTIDPLDDPNALRRQHSDPAGEQAQQAAGGGGEQ